MGLLDQPDAATLRFRSDQDAPDFGRHSVERVQHWKSSHSLDWPKRYIGNEIDIVLKLRTRNEIAKIEMRPGAPGRPELAVKAIAKHVPPPKKSRPTSRGRVRKGKGRS